MGENAEAKVDNVDTNTFFTFSRDATFSDTEDRKYKIPKFQKLLTLTEDIKAVQNEIKKQRKKLKR